MTTIERSTIDAELVQNARDLVETLRLRSADTIKNRRVSDETVADLRRTGLLKVLQAPRNGGYGLSIRTHLEVVSTLAEGCASTSWVVGVTHAHSWMMSHFPEKAQDETYGVDPDTFISAVIGARGRAVRTEGGFILNGAWPFGSGCENSQWLFLGSTLYDENDNVIEQGQFLLPTSDVSIRDDWYVTGLTGTGSCTMDVDNVFIPEHRYLPSAQLQSGDSPGAPLHEGTAHRYPSISVLFIALAGSSLGLARRCLEEVPRHIANKKVGYTEKKVIEQPIVHLRIAEAASMIDEAEFHLMRCADVLDSATAEGRDLTALEKARIRSDGTEAVARALGGSEILRKLMGGSGLSASNPVGVAIADLQAMSVHAGLSLDTARELYGRLLVGLDPDSLL